MNPVVARFQTLRQSGRKAFVPFLPAGDPDLALTRELLAAAAAGGASLIEVGFPFSDPIADGPVIQASYTRALAHKLTLADTFAALSDVTSAPGWDTPLVAMASYSLVWRMGPEAFIAAAQACGTSGIVVPDLPVEEADDFAKLCHDRDFTLSLLVTPTTAPERMAKIVSACRGFVYVVSVVGITGDRAAVPDLVRGVVTQLRGMTDLPLLIGFGVSTAAHVIALKDVADGVIVGTALVRKLEGAGSDRTGAVAAIRATVEELCGALG